MIFEQNFIRDEPAVVGLGTVVSTGLLNWEAGLLSVGVVAAFITPLPLLKALAPILKDSSSHGSYVIEHISLSCRMQAL